VPSFGLSVIAGTMNTASTREGAAMNNAADNGEDFGAALAFLGLVPFVVVLFVWFLCAVFAAAIAADRNRSSLGSFCLTFFLLGPLGVAVAVLATRGEMDRLPPAPEKRKVAEGRQRFVCPRCGAESDIPNADTSYDCWRCGEHRKVKPKVTTAKKS
jgi:DNA-directed RNA polymerase subunit RPC12/RpoP